MIIVEKNSLIFNVILSHQTEDKTLNLKNLLIICYKVQLKRKKQSA